MHETKPRRVVVTSENFGDLLVASAQQVVAFEQGEHTARIVDARHSDYEPQSPLARLVAKTGRRIRGTLPR